MILTTNSCRVGEGLVNVRIHINKKVFGHSQRLISIVDLVLDPVSEWLTNNGSSHVTYPLFWQPLHLFMILRIVLKTLWGRL